MFLIVLSDMYLDITFVIILYFIAHSIRFLLFVLYNAIDMVFILII